NTVYRSFHYSNHSTAGWVLDKNPNASLVRIDDLLRLNSTYTPFQPESMQGLIYTYADPKKNTYERSNLIQNTRGEMFLLNTPEFKLETAQITQTQAWELLER